MINAAINKDDMKNKILITILTCSKTEDRAKACLDTWIKDIKKPHDYFFYGDSDQAKKMEKTWDCSPEKGELRARLPEKTYKMLLKSLEYNWDFLFKCDDDTYVKVEELVNLLDNFEKHQDLYMGKPIRSSKGYCRYAQGGGGYVLSRKAVSKCVEKMKYIYNDHRLHLDAEDYSIGLALEKQNIPLIGSKKFAGGSPNQKEEQPFKDIIERGMITSHYVKPKIMNEIYNCLIK
jgi:hypothetical protein